MTHLASESTLIVGKRYLVRQRQPNGKWMTIGEFIASDAFKFYDPHSYTNWDCVEFVEQNTEEDR